MRPSPQTISRAPTYASGSAYCWTHGIPGTDLAPGRARAVGSRRRSRRATVHLLGCAATPTTMPSQAAGYGLPRQEHLPSLAPPRGRRPPRRSNGRLEPPRRTGSAVARGSPRPAACPRSMLQRAPGLLVPARGREHPSPRHWRRIGVRGKPGLGRDRVDREGAPPPALALAHRNLGHRHPDPPAIPIEEPDEDEGDERDGDQHRPVLDARDVQDDDRDQGNGDRRHDPADRRSSFSERPHRR